MKMPLWLSTRRAKVIAVSLVAAVGLVAGGSALTKKDNQALTSGQRTQASTAPGIAPSSTPAPAVTIPTRAHSPLTGLPGKPAYRVIAVKVNNILPNEAGVPLAELSQFGIGSADVVVEELVEGGLTRLLPMYQSHLPTIVGPVRSLRSTDSYVLLPVRALLLSSGGSGREVRDLKQRGVDFRTGGAGYRRLSSRSGVYNEMVDPHTLRQRYNTVPDLLRFGSPNLSKAKIVTRLTVRFSSKTISFTYRNGIYIRSPDLAQVPFRAKNVLVLTTPVRTLFVDKHGSKVPEEVLTGSGVATLYTHGRMITGQWHKSAQSSPIRTTFLVPPGKTAVELMPANAP